MELELEQIYREYMNDLYRYLYSLTHHHTLAEDLLQETFAKAHIMLLGGGVRDIKPWLFKVAYYTYIDSVRKERRFIHSDTIDKIDPHTPEQITLEKDSFQRLLDLLETIKPIEKQAILLCDVHDCTNEQAAEILHLKLNTLKSHLARGRRKLREKLLKEENKCTTMKSCFHKQSRMDLHPKAIQDATSKKQSLSQSGSLFYQRLPSPC